MAAEHALLQSLEMMARAARTGLPRPATAAWRYRSFAELVLAEGRQFIPSEVGAVPAEWRGEPSTCYVSAALWAAEAGLAYVEGWAATGLLAFGTEHAWCAQRGRSIALDSTWAEPGDAYIGVPFDPVWRRRYPVPGLFTVQHPLGRELLAHGLPDDARIDAGLSLPRADLSASTA